MNILGIFLILVLPFATGVIFNFITRQKKTNQIETYLIGFFSFFLIQGAIFSLYNFVNVPYELCSKIFMYLCLGILVAAIIIAIFGFKNFIAWDVKKLAFKKEERLSFAVLLLAVAVVVTRVILIYNFERDDLMLETVRINVLTSTVNTYNPMTARLYELGIINSKKLVTMPIYYTFWCTNFGIDARVLLYIVCTLQTFVGTLFACRCAMKPVIKSRRKQFLCSFFIAVLVASGDYFKGAIGYKILWNGYDGSTIIVAVMMAYIIFLLMDMYKLERGDFGKATWGQRIVRIFKLLICLGATLFMSGLATGLLYIVLCLLSMIVCTTLRFEKEEKA